MVLLQGDTLPFPLPFTKFPRVKILEVITMALFREVDKNETFPDIEERVLTLWDKDESFKKSLDSRPETEPYTFYDGPPFATGLPHYGHLLAGTIKDIVPRYWTMKGKKVPRGFGFLHRF